MDGDSSTTDASQLGISADYIGGSHVIQPHNDTEDSMNDHEDTNGPKESFREQDIYFSRAMVAHAFNPSTWVAEAGGFLNSRPAWSTE